MWEWRRRSRAQPETQVFEGKQDAGGLILNKFGFQNRELNVRKIAAGVWICRRVGEGAASGEERTE